MSIQIIKPAEMSEQEVNVYVEAEKIIWMQKGKKLARVEITLDGDYVLITSTEKSPITRLRRITGYLSKLSSFNDSKAAEHKDRVKHIK